jgi:glycosyltransferase involved in cell wall biosynthesis
MRIVHVLNGLPTMGDGIANSTVDLACTQSLAGHDVSVVSSGGDYIDLLSRYNVRHHTVRIIPRSIKLELLRDLPRLRRVILSARPEIVHTHTMTATGMMHLGRAFAGFGDYGLVTTVHSEWRRSSDLMRFADYVIVLSHNGKISFIERGFPAHKLQVIPHGIVNSPRRAGELEDAAHRDVDQVIVTAAGLYVRKGIGELIQAFGQIADEFHEATLLILGWGPDRELFERQKESVKGSGRIRLLGFVDKPRAIFRQAGVFVLASYTESFPLAMLEAREAGCAIVGANVGGIPELLEHGRAGLLIPPRDPDALAQALRRLLGNPNELARWRDAAHSNLEWLTCERMEEQTAKTYVSLLEERAALRNAKNNKTKPAGSEARSPSPPRS